MSHEIKNVQLSNTKGPKISQNRTLLNEHVLSFCVSVSVSVSKCVCVSV